MKERRKGSNQANDINELSGTEDKTTVINGHHKIFEI